MGALVTTKVPATGLVRPGSDAMPLLLLAAMLGLVFVVSWVVVDALVWAVVLTAVTLVGGAVLGMSTDLDD